MTVNFRFLTHGVLLCAACLFSVASPISNFSTGGFKYMLYVTNIPYATCTYMYICNLDFSTRRAQTSTKDI